MYSEQTIWSEILPSLAWSRNWHTKEDNEVIYKYASLASGDILEIGSAEGQSGITMLLANDLNRLICVEPYVSTNLLTNIKAQGLGWRVVILPALSRSAVWNNTVELLLIDAVHTYDEVKHDLEKWSKCEPKYIVLHDTSLEGVNRAVLEFIENKKYVIDFRGNNISILKMV